MTVQEGTSLYYQQMLGSRGIWASSPTMHGQLDFSRLFGGLVPPGVGMAMGMGLQPYINQFISGQGLMPGPFQSIQNLADYHQATQHARVMREVSQFGQAQDRAQLNQTISGFMRLFATGGRLTPGQESMASSMAGGLTNFLPMMASMAPGMTDQLLGIRGSASVMAMQMAAGSRFLTDPGGFTGLSSQQAGHLAQDVSRMLYGPGANITAMRGIGGASAGQMFEIMAQRGLIGTVSPDDAQAILRTPGGQEQLRTMNAGRTASRMREMAGAVAAMRDLFGDMGRGDAPMAELINSLESMTQGGLSTMSPQRIERIVRNTQQIAKMTGVSLSAVAQMNAGLSQMADQLGVDRGIIQGSVINPSLAFGQAHAQTVGGATAWGAQSKERMIAIDQRLRMSASNSMLANQLGALVRLGDQNMLKGDAAKLYREVISGNTSNVRLLGAGEFVDLLAAGGVDRSMASSAMNQVEANRESFQRHGGLLSAVRASQWQTDLAPRLSRAAGLAMGGILGKYNLDGGTARQVSMSLGTAAVSALQSMSNADRMDPTKRTNNMIKAMFDALPPELRNRVSNEDLRQMAVNTWGEMEQIVRSDSNLRATYESGQGLFGAHSRETAVQAARVEAQARTRAFISEQLSGLGAGTPITRLIEAINRGDNAADIAARVLGGVDSADAIRRATPALRKIDEAQRKINKLGLELQNARSPEDAARIRALIEAESSTIRTLMHGTNPGAVQTMAERMGVSIQELLAGVDSSGQALNATDVAFARANAGLADNLGLLSYTPEAHALKRADRMRRIASRAGTEAGDVAEHMDMIESLVLQAARGSTDPEIKRIMAQGDLTDEDKRTLTARAMSGKLGANVQALFGTLDDEVRELLEGSGLSLGEVSGGLRAAEAAREARTMTLNGELRITSDGRGLVSATGVRGDSGGTPPRATA